MGFQNRIAGVDNRPPRSIQWRNTLERFGLRAQVLHAIIGLAIIFMLPLGVLITYWPHDWAKTIHMNAVILHKGLGFWIFVLGVVWVIHYLKQLTPERLPNQTRPAYRLAKLVHKLLLFLCIAMPLSGWIMVSAWGDRPIIIAPYIHIPTIAKSDAAFGAAMFGVHIVLAWMIAGLLALHIGGSIYHHIIKRDPILKRMVPRFRAPAGYYRFQFDRARDEAKKLK